MFLKRTVYAKLDCFAHVSLFKFEAAGYLYNLVQAYKTISNTGRNYYSITHIYFC